MRRNRMALEKLDRARAWHRREGQLRFVIEAEGTQ